jgi:hypothetical protein
MAYTQPTRAHPRTVGSLAGNIFSKYKTNTDQEMLKGELDLDDSDTSPLVDIHTTPHNQTRIPSAPQETGGPFAAEKFGNTTDMIIKNMLAVLSEDELNAAIQRIRTEFSPRPDAEDFMTKQPAGSQLDTGSTGSDSGNGDSGDTSDDDQGPPPEKTKTKPKPSAKKPSSQKPTASSSTRTSTKKTIPTDKPHVKFSDFLKGAKVGGTSGGDKLNKTSGSEQLSNDRA